jgi:hypothetical protein
MFAAGGNLQNGKAMRKNIVLISCSSQKLSHHAKAKNLYTSTLFKLSLKFATKLAPDEIYILSAKHGLLGLDQEIEPYEQTLNSMSSSEIQVWAHHVLKQIEEVCSISESEFTFLAGDKYRKHLLPILKDHKIPLKGRRIGEQLQILKRLTS